MSKKKKSVENDWKTGWRCGDCDAWNDNSVKNCAAPQHEHAVEALRVKAKMRQLIIDDIENITRDYMTADAFVDDLAKMMKEFLVRMYGEEPSHPRDLTSAAATFMDAYFIISEHRDL